MPLEHRVIATTHAEISVLEGSGAGLPVVFIHGNSSCKEVFSRQLDGLLAETRVIALDLPGHGRSGNAHDPARTYSVPGYAETVAEVLGALEVPRAAVLGWSLGGHIGLQLSQIGTHVAGLMMVGAPPHAPGMFGITRAFHSNLGMLLAGKGRFTPGDVRRFGRVCLGETGTDGLYDMIARTDPRARKHLARAMLAKRGADQKQAAENAAFPLAMINGIGEPFARLDYVDSLAYANLWDGRCYVLEGAAHAPFREQPNAFNALFTRFLNDVASRERALAAGGRAACTATLLRSA